MIWLFWRVSVAMERLAGWAERAGSWAAVQQVRALDRQHERDRQFMGDVDPLTREQQEQALIQEWAVRMRDGWGESSWPGWSGGEKPE